MTALLRKIRPKSSWSGNTSSCKGKKTPAGINQINGRDPIFHGDCLGPQDLLCRHGEERAGLHRGVIGDHHDQPPRYRYPDRSLRRPRARRPTPHTSQRRQTGPVPGIPPRDRAAMPAVPWPSAAFSHAALRSPLRPPPCRMSCSCCLRASSSASIPLALARLFLPAGSRLETSTLEKCG